MSPPGHPEGAQRSAPQAAAALYPQALITLRAAAVAFGAVQALLPLDLSLHHGERLALVGANGSGKTTLLRLLHGLLPSAGQRHVQTLQSGRAPVMAMLFQRPFVLSVSVRLNLHVGLWLQGVPRARRADCCTRALNRVGLLALADRDARTLSGGQLQRLALARAWAMKPDVLLLDEPTASLDPSAKREVEALIEDLTQEGVTLVIATHNLGQAKRLATRVVYLESGRMVVDLPVEPFFNGPLPTEAALFLKGELPWAPR